MMRERRQRRRIKKKKKKSPRFVLLRPPAPPIDPLPMARARANAVSRTHQRRMDSPKHVFVGLDCMFSIDLMEKKSWCFGGRALFVVGD